MKLGWVLCILLCLVLLGWLWWQNKKRQMTEIILGMTPADGACAVTKHDQLAVLEAAGITLPQEEATRILWQSTPEQSEYYARFPYWGLLGDPALTWDCVYSPGDPECVDGEDPYAAVFQGMPGYRGCP